MDAVTQMVFMIAILLLLGAIGEFIFSRTGIPDMIWLVVAGIVAGPVLKVIDPKLFEPILPFFGAVALVSILGGGGISLRIAEVTEAAPRALLLAILGFVLTIVAFCLFAHVTTKLGFIKPFGLPIWIMVGAILGGTSSLVIIPTMAGGNVDKRVARLLEVESCMTDAMCVVVAIMMIDLILKGSFSIGAPVKTLSMAIGIGVGIGVAGAAGLLPLNAPLYDKPHAYTVFLAAFLIIYGVAQHLHGNGALSVLIAALIIGNASEILPKLSSKRFDPRRFALNQDALKIHHHISFFIKSFFFFLIGLMFPTTPKMILIGAAFAFVMLLFRIPAAVVALKGAKFSWHQISIVSVSIPRGLAAGVLSALPVHYGVPGMENLSQAVFSSIVFSILIFTMGFSLVRRMGQQTRNH